MNIKEGPYFYCLCT